MKIDYPMNSKSILFFSLFAAVALAASGVSAAPRGGGHFGSMGGGGHNWHGGNWSGHNWHGGNWGGNWHHHHFHNNVVFIGDFGFPGWWGWGWPYWGWGPWWGWDGYPYGYGYGYPSGYGYGYGYGGNQYGDSGYGRYGDSSRSRVAELQRRLARAGYYHGAVDGVMGPQTRQAIRAYERDHGYAG
ncbi:MAG: hypothetical protein DME33_10755 [Verrucomicrobia bacterium]|nr:MAG: hypothetical protein DME33_10755 [Verrucomicrobiota bacterium]